MQTQSNQLESISVESQNLFLINDETYAWDSSLKTISDLLTLFPVELKGLAIAQNGEVIPKSNWSTTTVRSGDEFSFFTMVAGG
ncbi:MAG: sulfur carrier protein ThiS [Vibrio sp.]